jgi:Recombination endonuclease VII
LKNAPAHIDHDHVTGTVRGVLCFTCNAALGQLQDDPAIIRRAAAYVEGQVWQPTKLAPGVYRLPSSPPAARALPTS